jgi:hypothetical protein
LDYLIFFLSARRFRVAVIVNGLRGAISASFSARLKRAFASFSLYFLRRRFFHGRFFMAGFLMKSTVLSQRGYRCAGMCACARGKSGQQGPTIQFTGKYGADSHRVFSTGRIVTDRGSQSTGVRNRTWGLPDEKFAQAPHPNGVGSSACPGGTPYGSSEIEYGPACLSGTGLKDDPDTL